MNEKIVTILAGGWSASSFDLRKLPGKVIAVNDSAYYAPRWDICVSMDRMWGMHRQDWICRQSAKRFFLRRNALERYGWKDHPHVTLFENDHESIVLSDDKNRFNGTHSGFCALNLAYKMRPADLYLVGFDMARGPRDEAHWFPQYSWVSKHATGVGRLAEWSKQFEIAARQLKEARIRVHLCGANSAIRTWKQTGREGLDQACAA